MAMTPAGGEGRDRERRRTGLQAGERVVWLLLAIGLIGAAGFRAWVSAPLYPVRGRLLVDGKPAAGAIVVCHPAGGLGLGGAHPSAQVRADGSFQLSTRTEGDGAPAGSYVVTIDWPETIQAGGESFSGRSLVPEIYAGRGTTPLKLTVQGGRNDLEPFRIDHRADPNNPAQDRELATHSQERRGESHGVHGR